MEQIWIVEDSTTMAQVASNMVKTELGDEGLCTAKESGRNQVVFR